MKRNTERTIASFFRIAIVAIVILMQIVLIMLLVRYLRTNALWVYILIEFAAIIQMLVMANKNRRGATTVSWVIVIAALPVFGYILYLLWGRSETRGKRCDRTRASIAYGEQYLEKDPTVYAKLTEEHPRRKRISGYLGRMSFPLYQNTCCQYYPLGEQQFDAMIKDMEKAEKFIFMQYFILDGGVLWNRIRDVLAEKAKQGVEIRLMYDDLGSILCAPEKDLRKLKESGVQIIRYNPVHKFISRLFLNFRNHQKMTIVDGHIAYTGGTNIADEYINAYPKHGHWKDTGIRIEGAAAWSMTVTFLSMWNGETGESSEYDIYHPQKRVEGNGGYFQPFADGPVNNPDNPAEVMYRTIIANAMDYVYITTPYLVIDNAMQEELITAARSGVDVRIITPRVYDHWYVHNVTRSNYLDLLRAGVRIYEYVPGYIHGKTIISDDDHAVTGSINMDYRSFHMQFENGVWICGDPVLKDIKQDILQTMDVSEEILLESWEDRPWYTWLLQGILRVFAILM